MNYLKIYNQLIEKRRINTNFNNEYTEVHHIIPSCLNGTNDDKNLIRLTAREHFIAHYLLCKIYPGNRKLLCALNRMCSGNYNNGERYTSHLYQFARKKFSNYMKNKICVVDQYNNRYLISRDDPRYLSGELKSIMSSEQFKLLRSKQISISKNGSERRVYKEELNDFLNDGWVIGLSAAKRKMPNVTGKIHINNGIKTIMIKKELFDEYSKAGWKLGKLISVHNKGKIFVHKDGKNIYISKEDLTKYLANGWYKGIDKTNRKKQCYINNGKIEKRINEENINIFLNDGWTRGRLTKPCQGMLHIIKNNRMLYIKKKKLNEYLKDGWIIGNLPKKEKHL